MNKTKLTAAQKALLTLLRAGAVVWCHESTWARAGLFWVVATDGEVTRVRHYTVTALLSAGVAVYKDEELPSCHDTYVVAA